MTDESKDKVGGYLIGGGFASIIAGVAFLAVAGRLKSYRSEPTYYVPAPPPRPGITFNF